MRRFSRDSKGLLGDNMEMLPTMFAPPRRLRPMIAQPDTGDNPQVLRALAEQLLGYVHQAAVQGSVVRLRHHLQVGRGVVFDVVVLVVNDPSC